MDAVLDKDFFKNTPIWLNPTFSIQINREWLNNGISTIAYFLGTMNVVMSMEEFMTTHNVKTNFLDYNFVTSEIKKYIEWKEMLLYQESAPRNSALNVILNLSTKGTSKLYSIMKDSFSHVLDIAADKWNDNADLEIGSFSLDRSFQYHHLRYKDTYLKYIQFRTLHHRVYTKELLCKMGINNSNLCSFGLKEIDSVEHMLLLCEVSIELWQEVGNWIIDLGMENYHLSSDKIILGDMENATSINIIILLAKKTIYNSMKKEQKPNTINVKNDVKNFYYQEKYRHYIRGRGKQFGNNIYYCLTST